MHPLKIIVRFVCLAASVIGGMSCSSIPPVAGWGSETTNGVGASIVHKDGSPAAGAKVRLHRSDYLTSAVTTAKLATSDADVTTDIHGRFEITGIDSGYFSIEINDGASALLFTCSLKDHAVKNLGVDTLRPYAAISGSIDSVTAPVYVQVFGLERLVRTDSAGRYTITDLPQGDLDLRIVENAGGSVRPMVVSHVKTIAGQTTAVSSSANWSWSRRLYLNTAAAGVTEDVENFPLLLRLDSSNFDFTQINGSSPSFMFAKEDRSPLAYEIAAFDLQAKTALIWVTLDTVHGGNADRFITMSWSDVPRSQQTGIPAFDTARGFSGVWHLEENGSGASGEFRDATSDGNNGTGGNSVAAQTPTRVSGVVGSAQSFDGSDDYIQVPGRQSLDFSDKMTASFWFYYDSAQAYNARILSKDMDWDVKIVSGRPQISMGGAYYSADASLQQRAWNHVAVTLSGLSGAPIPAIYLNGRLCVAFESTFPDSFAVASRNSSGDLFFGQLGNGSFYLHGAIDEIWLQRNARPVAWIALMYEDQRKGGGLVDFSQ